MKTPIERVIISGGGTGGHIFPALSIAGALRRRYPGVDILFVGADNRMEMQRVPAAGYPIVGLPVAGFDRKHLWRNFRTLWLLMRSMRKARKTVRDFRPQIAIGVGGYCSGPTLKAAQKLGVPTLIQEQNGYPGVTNKLLGKKADAICVAYEGTERFFPAEKIHMTGNPVRESLLHCTLTPAQAREKLGFDPAGPLVLVVGGSLGATTVNKAIAAGVKDIVAAGAQLLWQTGKRDTELAAEATAGVPGARASRLHQRAPAARQTRRARALAQRHRGPPAQERPRPRGPRCRRHGGGRRRRHGPRAGRHRPARRPRTPRGHEHRNLGHGAARQRRTHCRHHPGNHRPT